MKSFEFYSFVTFVVVVVVPFFNFFVQSFWMNEIPRKMKILFNVVGCLFLFFLILIVKWVVVMAKVAPYMHVIVL